MNSFRLLGLEKHENKKQQNRSLGRHLAHLRPSQNLLETNWAFFGLRTYPFGPPFGLRTDSFGLQTDPFGLRTDPFGLWTDPFGLWTDPFGQQTDLSGLQTDPSGLWTDPGVDPNLSQMAQLYNQSVPSFHQLVLAFSQLDQWVLKQFKRF